MQDKITLPKCIEARDAVYTLAYVPGNSYIEPNFAGMQPAAADCSLVTFAGQKKWMAWIMMDCPARIGSATPPKRFLLFRLYDQPIQPIPAMFSDMIVYLVSPIECGTSPAQQFLDALVGKREQEINSKMPKDDWTNKLFNIVSEDASHIHENSEELPVQTPETNNSRFSEDES